MRAYLVDWVYSFDGPQNAIKGTGVLDKKISHNYSSDCIAVKCNEGVGCFRLEGVSVQIPLFSIEMSVSSFLL